MTKQLTYYSPNFIQSYGVLSGLNGLANEQKLAAANKVALYMLYDVLAWNGGEFSDRECEIMEHVVSLLAFGERPDDECDFHVDSSGHWAFLGSKSLQYRD